LILRGHGSNASATPPGDVGRRDGWAPHGALGGPAGIPGVGLGILAGGQERAVLPLAPRCRGTQRKVARMEGEHPIRRPEGGSGTARPRVAGGIMHQARADGGAIQIPEGGHGVGVLRDQTGPIPPLPAVPPPSPARGERAGRFRHESAERAATRLVRGGPHQGGGPVSRPQRGGVHGDRVRPDPLPQMGAQDIEVFGRGERALPVIAPGPRVPGAPRGEHPRCPRHPASHHGAPSISTQWIRPHGIPPGCPTRQDLNSPLKQINELAPQWCPVPFSLVGVYYLVPGRAANDSQVVIGLQIEPGLCGCPEILGEPEGGIGRDAALAVHNTADPVGPMSLRMACLAEKKNPLSRRLLEFIGLRAYATAAVRR